MKHKTIALVIMGVLVVGLSAPWWANALMRAATIGPEHAFPLDEQPAVLTEELALEMARLTLAREGFDPVGWEPYPNESATVTAPNGTLDRYFERHDPEFVDLEGAHASGSFLFFCKSDHMRRIVYVELRDREIVCWIVHPL